MLIDTRDRPILMNGPMVRATLDGSKTMTRRHLYVPTKRFASACFDRRYQPPVGGCDGELMSLQAWTLSQWFKTKPGDRLWVRETWQGPLLDSEEWEEHCNDSLSELPDRFRSPAYCQYAADGGPTPEFMTADDDLVRRWRPSIHMPRWASRITLEVTGVRVERLKEISDQDCIAEGIQARAGGWAWYTGPDMNTSYTMQPVTSFRSLWDSINGPDDWHDNPWVLVIEFRRIKP